MYGRKTPIEEYVKRIRTARHNDGTKMFQINQYLTSSQVNTSSLLCQHPATNAALKGTKSDSNAVDEVHQDGHRVESEGGIDRNKSEIL